MVQRLVCSFPEPVEGQARVIDHPFDCPKATKPSIALALRQAQGTKPNAGTVAESERLEGLGFRSLSFLRIERAGALVGCELLDVQAIDVVGQLADQGIDELRAEPATTVLWINVELVDHVIRPPAAALAYTDDLAVEFGGCVVAHPGTVPAVRTDGPGSSSTLEGKPMPSAVTLIRSATLSDVAEYAYAATIPSDCRLIFWPVPARCGTTGRPRPLATMPARPPVASRP